MTVGRDFDAAAKAYQKLAETLKELDATKRAFESAGIPLPEQLKEFFGLNRNGRGDALSIAVPPPTRRHTPSEAGKDWISIPAKDSTATTLVLAVLRKAGKQLPAKDVIDLVTEVNPLLTRGGINNIGTRLSGKEIIRDDDGWMLSDPSIACVLDDGYLWGPKELFDKQDIAAHRREAILLTLRSLKGGLQTAQIVEVLRGNDWVKAPIIKDLVKADMEALEGLSKVKRVSNSKKWIIRED